MTWLNVCVHEWCASPVSSTRLHIQEMVATSRLIFCRAAENSRMASTHWPKPRRHWGRSHTEPSQKCSRASSGSDLGVQSEGGLDFHLWRWSEDTEATVRYTTPLCCFVLCCDQLYPVLHSTVLSTFLRNKRKLGQIRIFFIFYYIFNHSFFLS